MVRCGNVADVANVGGHGLVCPAFAAEKKSELRSQFRGAQEELFNAGFAVGEAVAEEGDVAGKGGIGRDGMMRLRIEAVVDAEVGARAEGEIVVRGTRGRRRR